MAQASTEAGWTFLTNHAHVLICIALDPEVRMREVAARVGVTERAVQRIIADAKSWQDQVQDDAGLAYLQGLAWRYLGETERARAALLQAVALDPDDRAAWYDLGELYLADGELQSASEAFAQVTRLIPEGPEAWIGPWRQAEVAAARQDAAAFEQHLRAALTHGFDLRQIAGLPNWKAYLADPVVGPSVEKLITVYGSRDVLDSLR